MFYSEGRNLLQSAAHLDPGLGQSEELEQISKEVNTLQSFGYHYTPII